MSNADILNVNAGELEAAGQEFNSCGSQFEQIMTSMRNRSEALRGSWQGSAAESFYAKMDALFQEMRTLCDEVTEMGNDLNMSAADIRQAQATIQGRVQD